MAQFTMKETLEIDGVAKRVMSAALERYKEAAGAMKRVAEANAPVDKGTTKKSIRASARVNRQQTQIVGWLRAKSGHSLFPEVGTVHMPAQPFLRPARDGELGKLIDSLRDLV